MAAIRLWAAGELHPSQFADRQQPVLQRLVLPQLGCLAAERDASALERNRVSIGEFAPVELFDSISVSGSTW